MSCNCSFLCWQYQAQQGLNLWNVSPKVLLTLCCLWWWMGTCCYLTPGILSLHNLELKIIIILPPQHSRKTLRGKLLEQKIRELLTIIYKTTNWCWEEEHDAFHLFYGLKLRIQDEAAFKVQTAIRGIKSMIKPTICTADRKSDHHLPFHQNRKLLEHNYQELALKASQSWCSSSKSSFQCCFIEI